MSEESENGDEINFADKMPAMQAVLVLAPLVGGHVAAKAELADRMRDGSLNVYAQRAWDSRKPSIREAWREKVDPDNEMAAYMEDFEVGDPWVWRVSPSWQRDQEDWRWPSGRFAVTQKARPRLRYMFVGVHFDPDQIADVVAGLEGKQVRNKPGQIFETEEPRIDEPVGKKGKRRGPRVRYRSWGAILSECFRLYDEGMLTRSHFPTVEALAAYLKTVTKIDDEILAAETIEGVVRALYKEKIDLSAGPT